MMVGAPAPGTAVAAAATAAAVDAAMLRPGLGDDSGDDGGVIGWRETRAKAWTVVASCKERTLELELEELRHPRWRIRSDELEEASSFSSLTGLLVVSQRLRSSRLSLSSESEEVESS